MPPNLFSLDAEFCLSFDSVLALTIAAEIAAEKVEGPGGFLGALLDALAALTSEDVRTRAKVKISY